MSLPVALIPLPFEVPHGGEVLKAMLCQDGLAHGAGLHSRKGVAALADLLQAHSEQIGI